MAVRKVIRVSPLLDPGREPLYRSLRQGNAYISQRRSSPAVSGLQTSRYSPQFFPSHKIFFCVGLTVCKVDRRGRSVAQRLMRSRLIIELQIPAQLAAGLSGRLVVAKVNLLLLDRSPKAFGKEVVQRPPPLHPIANGCSTVRNPSMLTETFFVSKRSIYCGLVK